MIRPVLVRALPNYRLYLEFSDGTKGKVDLSNLAGREVFQAWGTPGFFEGVHIGSHREIKWDDEIELCADSLYLKLTGKTPEELFPKSAASNLMPELCRSTALSSECFG